MGLLRASLFFIIGNFTLSILDEKKNYLDIMDTLPVVGNFFGENIKKYIKENKTMALLIILTIVEFIL